MNNKVFSKNGEIFLLGGNLEYNMEIRKNYEASDEKSYKEFIKNDLNIFCAFNTFHI